MRLIIAGSRSFRDYNILVDEVEVLCLACDIKTDELEIISGGAVGADSLGEIYAQKNNLPLTIMKANWDVHGKSAGMVRNSNMAEVADACIVFWDGESRGSKNMIDIATKKGLKLFWIMI